MKWKLLHIFSTSLFKSLGLIGHTGFSSNMVQTILLMPLFIFDFMLLHYFLKKTLHSYRGDIKVAFSNEP